MRLIIIFTLICGCRHWTAGDIAREGTFGTLMFIDANQTVDITRRCREINPIIGKCGHQLPIAVYFPLVTVLHIVTANYLNSDWRNALQYFSIGVELNTVVFNVM